MNLSDPRQLGGWIAPAARMNAPRENEALVYRDYGKPREVLQLESRHLDPLGSAVRVQMLLAPINPSDLIPITGSYSHRVRPPRVAGYEGVGIVSAAPALPGLVGTRVLPLRGPGTWQRWADTSAEWLVRVPDFVPDDLACRAYINPLTALLMLRRWNPAGKRVLLTAASSSCASLLAQWAWTNGAFAVSGVARNLNHAERASKLGMPLHLIHEVSMIRRTAASSDLVFDAVGGALADLICESLPPDAQAVSYGLLSGQLPAMAETRRRLKLFRLVDAVSGVPPTTFQAWFEEIWPLLLKTDLPDLMLFELAEWREALVAFEAAGRAFKPALRFAQQRHS